MKIRKVEFERKDERGKLTQISTGDWKQLNYLQIKKDCSFGGHYHIHKEELFYLVSGDVEFKIKNDGGVHSIKLEKGDCLLVEPYDHHTIVAFKDSTLIELLSCPFDAKDVHTK